MSETTAHRASWVVTPDGRVGQLVIGYARKGQRASVVAFDGCSYGVYVDGALLCDCAGERTACDLALTSVGRQPYSPTVH